MLRAASLIGLFALAGTGTCATRKLLLGDAERGREVFETHSCVTCHGVNGQGGRIGPDLAQMVDRGFTPYRFAALLWNHAPAMFTKLDRMGIARPELTPQQAADLFAYLFALRSFEQPGNARRGKRVFRSMNCAQCHAGNDSLGPGVAPVPTWPPLDHPFLLALRMWNHPPTSLPRASGQPAPPLPHLTAQDLADLLVYLRSVQGRRRNVTLLPGSPAQGAQLFGTKGCSSCHYGSDALEGRPTRYTLNDFAAAMWNHLRPTPLQRVPINAAEMRLLAGYLLSIQFIAERGDAGRGSLLFEKKRCVACHEHPSGQTPGRSDMAGRMTSFDMAAALWKHGPAMRETMRRKNIPWPRLDGDDMADLTAYLHGYEFKRRTLSATPAAPPPIR